VSMYSTYVYEAPAVNNLLYGSEIWTLSKNDKRTFDIGLEEIFQKSGRFTLYSHKRNEEILYELQVEAGDDELRRYKT